MNTISVMVCLISAAVCVMAVSEIRQLINEFHSKDK